MNFNEFPFGKNPESISIICIGSWNTKIFTPIWVANYIFSIKIEDLEGLLNQEEIEVGYKNTKNDIFFVPRGSSIEIRLSKFDPEILQEAVKILNRILKELPHTPIKGIGFNFGYSFNSNSDLPLLRDIENKFNTFHFDDFLTDKVNLKKQYEDHILNLTLLRAENVFSVNFNFHYPKPVTFDENIFEKHLGLIQKCCNYE